LFCRAVADIQALVSLRAPSAGFYSRRMLALAHKVARVLVRPPQDALWTITAGHRVVGSLVCEAGAWRLAWFAGADPRLASYAGPVNGDVEALAAALSARLGAPVELESQPV
jgi:hypothetical protein